MKEKYGKNIKHSIPIILPQKYFPLADMKASLTPKNDTTNYVSSFLTTIFSLTDVNPKFYSPHFLPWLIKE